jgi:predicted ArsR family transcriptional regulator
MTKSAEAPRPDRVSDQRGDRRGDLMNALLHDKSGLTVDALSERLGITRTAIRQHLTALERDGYVTRGGTQPTGGRPEMLYILTESGAERFTRRYSWFADLLVGLLKAELGGENLRSRLGEAGASAAAAVPHPTDSEAPLSKRLGTLAVAMRELGYETDTDLQEGDSEVVAHNCIFHQLAAAHPEICQFDLGFMSRFANAEVEHVECMARGQHVCRFRFTGRSAEGK